MKLILLATAFICFAGCASSETKTTNGEQAATKEIREQSTGNDGDFSITLMEGGTEILKLKGAGTIATNDGKFLRIYLDDKEKQTSVVIETGSNTSGEYKISGSTVQKDNASVLIIPAEKLNLLFPVSLEAGTVKTSVNGNSGSGSIDGSSVLRGKTYSLKGTFQMKIEKN